MTRRQTCSSMAGMLLLAGCDKIRSLIPDRDKELIPVPDKGVIPATEPPKAAVYVPELQLDYAVLLNEGSTPKRITDKYHFKSGDKFRFEFRSAFAAYVYLLDRGARDKEYSFLYPNKRISQGNPLTINQVVTLPGGQEWYTLDNQPGIENMVLLAAAKPLPDFENSDRPIPRDEFEEKVAILERDHRPASSRRFEDRDWVRLFATQEDSPVIILRLPIDHT